MAQCCGKAIFCSFTLVCVFALIGSVIAAESVHQWSVADVEGFVSGQQLADDVVKQFAQRGIDGQLLMSLDDSDLEELGVPNSTRESLLHSIRRLRDFDGSTARRPAKMPAGSAPAPSSALYPAAPPPRDSWLPTKAEFMADLTYSPPLSADINRSLAGEGGFDVFDGYHWTRATSHHWEVPLIACAVYLVMVFVGPRYMRTRDKIPARPAMIVWNFALSIFSAFGAVYTVSALLFGPNTGFLNKGLYVSVCSHPVYYGSGPVGFFVCLFIYSKLFELVDTFFLIIRKNPVILLHWYHHVTVLLYCWHSYSVRISSGLWFAAMNYCVHAFMYFYFGMTQVGPRSRKMVKPFAIFLTLGQLTQMVVGIAVTVASGVYSAHPHKGCHSNATNSLLGLLMYFSYFLLFGKLFMRYFNKKPRIKQGAGASVAKMKKAN